MIRAALIDGQNINLDKDFSQYIQSISSHGIIEGFILDTSLKKGKAWIQVQRSNGEIFFTLIESSEDIQLNTDEDKKIFIQVNQENIDNGEINSEDGTGIAEIKHADERPEKNFLKLYEVVDGEIIDQREFAKIQGNKIDSVSNKKLEGEPNTLVYFDDQGKPQNVSMGAMDDSLIIGSDGKPVFGKSKSEVGYLSGEYELGEKIEKNQSILLGDGEVIDCNSADIQRFGEIDGTNAYLGINSNQGVVGELLVNLWVVGNPTGDLIINFDGIENNKKTIIIPNNEISSVIDDGKINLAEIYKDSSQEFLCGDRIIVELTTNVSSTENYFYIKADNDFTQTITQTTSVSQKGNTRKDVLVLENDFFAGIKGTFELKSNYSSNRAEYRILVDGISVGEGYRASTSRGTINIDLQLDKASKIQLQVRNASNGTSYYGYIQNISLIVQKWTKNIFLGSFLDGLEKNKIFKSNSRFSALNKSDGILVQEGEKGNSKPVVYSGKIPFDGIENKDYYLNTEYSVTESDLDLSQKTRYQNTYATVYSFTGNTGYIKEITAEVKTNYSSGIDGYARLLLNGQIIKEHMRNGSSFTTITFPMDFCVSENDLIEIQIKNETTSSSHISYIKNIKRKKSDDLAKNIGDKPENDPILIGTGQGGLMALKLKNYGINNEISNTAKTGTVVLGNAVGYMSILGADGRKYKVAVFGA